MIRLKIADIDIIGNKTKEDVDTTYLKASEDWKELHEKGKQIREEELLDYAESELANKIENEKKIRKRVLAKIKKEKDQLYQFKYLTKYIRKGGKESLRRLHEVDQEGNIIKTYLNKEDIEIKLI